MRVLCFSIILVALSFIETTAQNVEFSFSFGGLSAYHEGPVVKGDADGNTYLAGQFSGTVEFSSIPGAYTRTAQGESDMFVLKLNPQGQTVWVKTWGSLDADNVKNILLDNDGNIYVLAEFSSSVFFSPGPGAVSLTSIGGMDIAIFKLNSDGLVLWANSLGSMGNDVASSISFHDYGDSLLVCGTMKTQLTEMIDYDFSGGTHWVQASEGASFILKLSLNGDFAWAKTFPTGENNLYVDVFNQIWFSSAFFYSWDFDFGSGVNMVTAGPGGNNYTLRLDAQGNAEKLLFVKGGLGLSFNEIAGDRNGNIYQTGTFNAATDINSGVDTFIVAPLYNNGANFFDIFCRKLNNNGDFLWGNRTGGLSDENPSGLLVMPNGDVLMSGNFYYRVSEDPLGVDFNPGPGEFYLGEGHLKHAGFIQHLDSNGNFIAAHAIFPNHGGWIDINSLDYEPVSKAILASGYIKDTADMDPGPTEYNIHAPLDKASDFVLKLGYNIVGLEPHLGSNFSLYPNPAAEILTLEFDGVQHITSLELLNSLGQVVSQTLPASLNSQGSIIFIPVHGLLPGVYVCRVTTDQGSTSRKVVIE